MLRRLALAAVLALAPSLAAAQFAVIGPTQPTADDGDRLATTAWVNNYVNAGLPLASGKIWIGSVGNIAVPQTPSGDLTVSNAGVFTFGTVNANVGSFGSVTQCASVTVNAKGLVTAASQNVCTPAIASVTGLGTGVATALAVNVGSAGAFVTFNGALGTPSSGTATNLTGLPISTGVSGLGTGCATFLGTPSSANLRGCITDESGTGAALFQGGDLGTPSAGVATNITALNATQLTTGTVPAARMPALTGDCTSTVGTVATTCTGINGVNLNAAWTTYTPTVTCQTGTITTLGTVSGRSKTIGKTVIAEMDVTITTVGSCTGYLSFTLPVTAASNKYAGSSYDAATGFSGAAVILPAISTGASLTRRADSTTFAASGANIVTSITYEVP